MAGSIRQRGADSWQLRVHAGRDPLTGRKQYIARTFRGTKRDAGKALAALIVEAERLTPHAARKGSVEDLLQAWLEHASSSFSPRTISTTRQYMQTAIIPGIGGIQAAKLTPADLDRFYSQLLKHGAGHGPYAPATIRRVHGIVRRALTQGVRWGWISHNPAIDASPPRVPAKQLTPPTPEQVVQLFRLALDTDPDLAVFILLAASTGARRGELIALRWSDVDLDGAILSIELGIVLADHELIEQGTKTHQSRRVTIDPDTVAALANHQDRAQRLAVSVGATITRKSFVFSHEVDGSAPWHPDSTSRSFRTLCKKAGISGIRLHDLRHYVATRLLASGIDVRTVAGRLGHRNASTTLNVYAHFLPEADQEAASTLAGVFRQAREVQECGELVVHATLADSQGRSRASELARAARTGFELDGLVVAGVDP